MFREWEANTWLSIGRQDRSCSCNPLPSGWPLTPAHRVVDCSTTTFLDCCWFTYINTSRPLCPAAIKNSILTLTVPSIYLKLYVRPELQNKRSVRPFLLIFTTFLEIANRESHLSYGLLLLRIPAGSSLMWSGYNHLYSTLTVTGPVLVSP